MTEAATELDLNEVKQALLSGKSLIEHLNLPAGLSKALYGIAQGHYDAKRFTQAKESCIHLVLVDTHFPDAWALLGNCFAREGEFREALDAWAHSMYLKPNYALAHEVTRTALALKDPATALVGVIAMHKHAHSPDRQATVTSLAEELAALAAA